jgi:4-methylaminobutanoate oxidase (formaldehyde-forming)
MEKGYRDYGHDIDNTDNPFETGLGFAVSFKKPDNFLGKEALMAMKDKPLTRSLVQVLVKDPKALMFHAEVIHRNGKPVGYVRAASYGWTLGGAVGLAMIEAGESITPEYLENAKWEVDIAGTRYPATVSLKPLYDPEMKKIRA